MFAKLAGSWRTEQAARLKKPIQSLLGFFELAQRGGPIQSPERSGMRERVIADPVAFCARAAHQRGTFGRHRLPAHYEKRDFDVVPSQAIEHGRSDMGLRSIVEGQRDFGITAW